MELKFKFHPRQRQIEILGLSYAEERVGSWMSYISEIQDTLPRVKNDSWKGLLQKKVNLVLQSWSNPASRKFMRCSPKFWWIQCTIRKRLFLLEKGSGMTFLLANLSKETLFQPKFQNCSWDWYVVMTKNERETDGAVHWNPMGPILRKFFRSPEGENSRTRIGFNTLMKEATRFRFQCCMNSKNSLLKIRAIQGHTGGNVVAPELMGHVAIPYKWNDFLYHRGCSFNVTSILTWGLIAGGQSRRRRTWRWPITTEKSTLSQ